MTNPDSAPSRKPAKIIPFPAPKEELRLPWSDWIVSLFRTAPARIFDATERDEWLRKYQEEKSQPKPARKRAR